MHVCRMRWRKSDHAARGRRTLRRVLSFANPAAIFLAGAAATLDESAGEFTGELLAEQGEQRIRRSLGLIVRGLIRRRVED